MGTQDTTDDALRGELDGPGRELEETANRRLAEEAVHRLAFFDDVTGLPNRASMVRAVADAIDAKPAADLSGFVMVSIDDLSVVNDAFGYDVGDRLLVDAAGRLRELDDDSVGIARMSGNVFGLLLPRLGPDAAAAQRHVSEVVDRVLDAFTGAVELGDGMTIDGSVSIGSVLWVEHDENAEHDEDDALGADRGIATSDPHDVLKSADIARKRARRGGGRRRVQHFGRGMLHEAEQRVRLVSELRRGIDRGELQLYSQPIVDRERRVIGAEGLVRWFSPARGLVPPDEFIPIAEQTGIIVEIGAWVVEEACKVLASWQDDMRTGGLTFSVNLSEYELRVDGFGERMRRIMEKYRVAPGRLRIELTESALHTDVERTVRTLWMLKEAGVASALDDFGTGYSSLSYLQRMPVQQLKIDRSFVAAMDQSVPALALVNTIVQLGRTYGMQVTAEGVETEWQFDYLKQLGVDAFQGYLFGRPGPVHEMFA